MNESRQLRHPWLVAVWPGMGHVAISAGYKLVSKLDMHLFAEFSPVGLFEVEHIDEAVASLTELPAGRPHEDDSFHDKVALRLRAMLTALQEMQPAGPSGRRPWIPEPAIPQDPQPPLPASQQF